jgi:hypothetical protein
MIPQMMLEQHLQIQNHQLEKFQDEEEKLADLEKFACNRHSRKFDMKF